MPHPNGDIDEAAIAIQPMAVRHLGIPGRPYELHLLDGLAKHALIAVRLGLRTRQVWGCGSASRGAANYELGWRWFRSGTRQGVQGQARVDAFRLLAADFDDRSAGDVGHEEVWGWQIGRHGVILERVVHDVSQSRRI